MVFGQQGADGGFLACDESTVFGLLGRVVQNLPIFDLYLAEETQINEQFLGVLGDDLLQLLKDVVEYDLAGLLLELGQLGDRCGVEFDGGEGEVDLVLHLHAVLHEELLQDADDGFFGVVLGHQLGGELHWVRGRVR